MNRITTLLASVALVLVTVAAAPPEASVAKHLDAVNDIMETNVASPFQGLQRLREYVQRNLPDFAAQIAKAVVELDRIDDPVKRKERARVMLAKLEPPMKKLATAGARFDEAVRDSAAARDYMKDFGASYRLIGELLDGLDITGGGGREKASTGLCRAAYANLTRLTIDETLAKMQDMSAEMKAAAKKKAEEAMKGQEAGYLTGCKEAPSAAVSCMAAASSIADYQACATKQ